MLIDLGDSKPASHLKRIKKPLRHTDAEANSERNFYSPPNGFYTIFLLHSLRSFQPSPAI